MKITKEKDIIWAKRKMTYSKNQSKNLGQM